jgi:hypothetical protein
VPTLLKDVQRDIDFKVVDADEVVDGDEDGEKKGI